MIKAQTHPSKPTKAEVVEALNKQTSGITAMAARWSDGISAEVRAELLALNQPAFEVLVRLGLR